MITPPLFSSTPVDLERAGWGSQGGPTVGMVARRSGPPAEVATTRPRRDKGALWPELRSHVEPDHQSSMAKPRRGGWVGDDGRRRCARVTLELRNRRQPPSSGATLVWRGGAVGGEEVEERRRRGRQGWRARTGRRHRRGQGGVALENYAAGHARTRGEAHCKDH